MIMGIRDPMKLPDVKTKESSPASDDDISAILGRSGGAPTATRDAIPEGSFVARSVDDVIRGRQGAAEDILSTSKNLARSFEGFAEAQSLPLRRQIDMGAFDEQQALLGLSGDQAQRDAIAGIPQTVADRERNRRESEALLRSMAATGDIGSGAAILASQQLGGQQQAQAIQNRLSQLEPLAGISRSLASQVSQLNERARTRRANLEMSGGTQLANIRLGSAAPIISGIQQQAQLSGLQGIAAADQRAAQTAALANLAGQVAPAVIGAFNQPASQPVMAPAQQAGIPNAGTVGVA